MRLAIAAPISAVLLAVPALVVAATGTSGTTVQNYDQTYAVKKPGRSTGTKLAVASTDDTNPRNRQPKRITNFDITFPKGSRIDSQAAAQCKADASDFASASNPDNECPRDSKMGIGQATFRGPFPGASDTPAQVSAYNATKGILLLVRAPNLTLLLRPKWRGIRLLTTIPHTCVAPTSPETGCRDSFGNPQEMILNRLSLRTTPKSRRTRKGVRRLMTTPRTCPSGGWTFEADIKYADGSSINIPTPSPCSR